MATIDTGVMLTLPEAKQYLKIEGGDNDDVIKEILNGVWAACETYLGRTLKKATYADQKYDGSGSCDLIVEHIPVASVTKVISVKDGAELVLDTDYKVRDANAGIISLLDGAIFPKSILDVTVSYDGGYTTLPADLKLSVYEAVAAVYKRFSTGGHGVRSTGIGTERGIEFSMGAYPQSVRWTWDRYAKGPFDDM